MIFFCKKKALLGLVWIFLGWSCTASQVDRSPHINGVDKHFQNRRFAQALDILRLRIHNAKDKDYLLYLMEAGTILHTLRDWEKSNLAFLEANEIAENIRLSRGKEILAFIIDKRKQNFIGENFERVKIKLYIALNYIMLEEREKAFAYVRALNQELKDIRLEGYDYKQNFAARLLGAILAEEERDYNFARVQYNNMLAAGVHTDLAEESLYRLAFIENDQEELEKYSDYKGELFVYDKNMNRIPFPQRSEEIGSLVLIHASGIAPYKTSKGRIEDEPIFRAAFETTLAVLLATDEYNALNAVVLLGIVGKSQNPIPVYKDRKSKNLVTQPQVFVSDHPFTLDTMDDYRATVNQNYNDKYQDYVNYNVANIATRVLTVYLSSKMVEKAAEDDTGRTLGFMINIFGGASISALLKPDLRAWNLTYSNLQMKRIFLKPGDYHFKMNSNNYNYLSEIPETVTIEAGKNTFVLMKSF